MGEILAFNKEKPWPTLGDILVRRGHAKQYQIDFILSLQKQYKSHHRKIQLGSLLLKHRIVSAEVLQEMLTIQATLPQESVTDIVRKIEAVADFEAEGHLDIADEPTASYPSEITVNELAPVRSAYLAQHPAG